MVEIIKTTFQLRRGYEAAWIKNNPVLACGEPGFVIDKNLLKIGDGITPWNELEYLTEGRDGDYVFTANDKDEFPVTGDENFIYRARKEKKLYQWNSKSQAYELLNEVEITFKEDEELIIFS